MNKIRQIFLHCIVWLTILSLFLFSSSDNGTIRYESIVIFIYFGIVNIITFYINYIFILPRFLTGQKYVTLAFSIIGLVIVFGLIKTGMAFSLFKAEVLLRGPRNFQPSLIEYYFGAMLVSTFFVFLSTALKFGVDWFVNEKLRKSLENEKLITELAFLKSQINPHFLLNSLNNIYSLAYQRSEKAPEAILKLSEIMRYMLYESNDGMKVEIAKEIRYLESYIELQKLRFSNAVVKLEISEDHAHYTIVPLILIAFVENAFKHGIATDADHPIEIKINIREGQLDFRISNKKSVQNKDETGGIGLHNVRRRLDLLYAGKYNLDIEDTASYYSCELSLNLLT